MELIFERELSKFLVKDSIEKIVFERVVKLFRNRVVFEWKRRKSLVR